MVPSAIEAVAEDGVEHRGGMGPGQHQRRGISGTASGDGLEHERATAQRVQHVSPDGPLISTGLRVQRRVTVEAVLHS